MRYYSSESARHSTGWASEHFDAQANVHSIAAINISLRLGDVSADLKCARSLVRTAEIRSTLLMQKLVQTINAYFKSVSDCSLSHNNNVNLLLHYRRRNRRTNQQ